MISRLLNWVVLLYIVNFHTIGRAQRWARIVIVTGDGAYLGSCWVWLLLVWSFVRYSLDYLFARSLSWLSSICRCASWVAIFCVVSSLSSTSENISFILTHLFAVSTPLLSGAHAIDTRFILTIFLDSTILTDDTFSTKYASPHRLHTDLLLQIHKWLLSPELHLRIIIFVTLLPLIVSANILQIIFALLFIHLILPLFSFFHVLIFIVFDFIISFVVDTGCILLFLIFLLWILWDYLGGRGFLGLGFIFNRSWLIFFCESRIVCSSFIFGLRSLTLNNWPLFRQGFALLFFDSSGGRCRRFLLYNWLFSFLLYLSIVLSWVFWSNFLLRLHLSLLNSSCCLVVFYSVSLVVLAHISFYLFSNYTFCLFWFLYSWLIACLLVLYLIKAWFIILRQFAKIEINFTVSHHSFSWFKYLIWKRVFIDFCKRLV